MPKRLYFAEADKMSDNESERILDVLRRARSEIEQLKRSEDNRIAVVGMAARVPGAESVNEYWQLLRSGQSGIRDVSLNDLAKSGISPEVYEDKKYVRRAATFLGPSEFDAKFFGYSPAEADVLDPQHRVFLENAWTALEDAGYDAQQYGGRIGVFGGSALNSYIVNLSAHRPTRDSIGEVQAVVGNVMGLMPTRVSYHLDLRGPSCGIQTGCSTSLVAIHSACRSLIDGECDLALAGGVTVTHTTPAGYLYEEGNIASPDGLCRAFDAAGRGTVFGNGVGVVVLKPLATALNEGDDIRAVILGSATNNDGADKVGLLAPSVNGQAEVISQAIKAAGIDPATLSYVEAHGTATELGDPVEFAALDKAIGGSLDAASKRCAIGSAKTNLGHLDAAAGVAGLIKVVLSLQNKELPPSLNYEKPNPQIDFDNRPFYVNSHLSDWVPTGQPRRAGVSSFGMGGTNAHVIVEEAPEVNHNRLSDSREGSSWQVLPLSAKDSEALNKRQEQIVDHVRGLSQLDLQHQQPGRPSSAVLTDDILANMAYTLQIGRRAMKYRSAIVSRSLTEFAEMLEGGIETYVAESNASVAFMFPGQGAQYPGMTRELYQTYRRFRDTMNDCADILGPNLDLLDLVYGTTTEGTNGANAKEGQLKSTINTQPAMFAVEYALADLLISFGVQPNALIGHSLGEYVAACLAGVFSLSDALKLVQFRGQVMQRCESGSMLAVMQDEVQVQALLPDNLEIAVQNSRLQTVVAGSKPEIRNFELMLRDRDIACQLLQTSHAFHSSLMDPALDPLHECLSGIELNAPRLNLISNRTGEWLSLEQATNPDYWVEHLRHTVRFADGMDLLTQLPNTVFLEVGPGQTLGRLVKTQKADAIPIATLPGPHENRADDECLTHALAELWCRGVPLQWDQIYSGEVRNRIPLPTYPFSRTVHFVPAGHQAGSHGQDDVAASDQKREEVENWCYVPSWHNRPLIPSREMSDPLTVIFGEYRDLGLVDAHLSTTSPILVQAGAGWRGDEETITIDPDCKDDYVRLWQELEARHGAGPLRLVCPWTPTQSATIAFERLVCLAQSLASRSSQETVDLTVLTSGLVDVTSEEEILHEQSVLVGLLNSLPHEVAGLRCRAIDLPASFQKRSRMKDVIARELSRSIESTDRLIALRERRRWVQSFTSVPLTKSDSDLLSEGATYLVVGDLLDGLNMVYAQSLRNHLAAKVILVGPSDLPVVNEWDSWLATHGNRHPVSQLIHRIKALGRESTDFVFCVADLHDASGVESAVTAALDRIGKTEIQGLFYGGVMGGEASCPLGELDKVAQDRILNRKISTVAALDRLLDATQPHFAVLQSSLSSIVGGPGFAAYAAASSFLDAAVATMAATYSERREASEADFPIVSINWDACQLEESSAFADSELMAQAIQVDEIWEVTKRILAATIGPQVAVSPRPLIPRVLAAAAPDVCQIESMERQRPNIATEYVAPRTPVEKAVAKAMADLLGISKIGLHDDFFALGGHSLLAIQAITKLRKQFNVDLPMRAILQGTPTVAGISEVVVECLPDLKAEDVSIVEDLLGSLEAEQK